MFGWGFLKYGCLGGGLFRDGCLGGGLFRDERWDKTG